MMNLNPGELLKEIGITGLIIAIVEAAKEAFKDGAKKVGDKIVIKITKEMEEEKRAEMLAFIRSLAAEDKLASDTLMERQQARQRCQKRSYEPYKPYEPGDENKFVKLLTKLYIALDELDERNARTQVFIWLGNINDEDFDARLEFLDHDIALQYLKWALVKAKALINRFCSSDVYKKIDGKAIVLADQIKEKNRKFERRDRPLLAFWKIRIPRWKLYK